MPYYADAMRMRHQYLRSDICNICKDIHKTTTYCLLLNSTGHYFFISMEAVKVRHHRKHPSRRSITDPFQVFCMEKRQEVSAANPDENVSGVTSILAAMWRSMSTDKKLPYVQLARLFDLSQGSGVKKKEKPPTPMKELEQTDTDQLCLPCIHIVKRNKSGEDIEETSIKTLIESMTQGG